MKSPPRLLLGAYSCHPDRGSEPTVGWNRAVEAARIGDVDVITHVENDNQEAIGRAVERLGLEGLRFHFLAHTPAEAALMRLPGGYYFGYRAWQRRAFRLAEALHAEAPFDLVHQVNMCGYREPGYLWQLGAPFVWGPVGTQNSPWAYLPYTGLRTMLTEGLRSVLNEVQLRTSRHVRRAAQAARLVLVANSTGQADVRRAWGVSARRLLETGIRSVSEAKRWADRPPGPLRVLWAGEVVERKGIRLAVDAISALRAAGGPEVELVVVGDGPARDLVRDMPGIVDLGWIPRPDLLALYRKVDVLAFTSLRDTSGNVMLEALAAGLPVIYLDHQGAADVCSDQCGIPIPVDTPQRSVVAISDAIAALATRPEVYDCLSHGAIARAHDLDWRVNGRAMADIYAQILRPSAPSSPARPSREAVLS